MRQVVSVGHRGAAGHAPENTLDAVHKGIALGADFVEIDVRRTADGALVALHDATVNRTTNGKGRVDRMRLRDVKQLDAGNGEQIPTLEEVLEAAAGRAGLMLELKVPGAARQTVEAVRKAGFKDPVIYASFLHDELPQVLAIDRGASLMVLFGRLPSNPVAHSMQYKPSHVGLRHDTANRRLVEAFHTSNLLVFVYTPNSPRDICRTLSVGVDGVISNFPERLDQAGGKRL
ncbi:MAG TPA: glycerophosphodiester phosphodiesterase family protein [Terriglobales bacterium]|nr:glycerophosphodiester phosphodiesterase family protein [Terriglobales bacterium]